MVIPGLALLAALLFAGCGSGAESITPAQARALAREDSTVVLVDVRTPEEFRSDTGHLPGALLIPLQELERRAGELEPYRERPLVVYCRTGRRSERATDLLRRRGFQAQNMEGGIMQWRAEGLPVVQEKP